MYQKHLEIYKAAIEQCLDFELKGKTMPYTSANGHMFSQLNKDAELGIRFSKEVQQQYLEQLETTKFKSYGSELRGYVQIPDSMWEKPNEIAKLLQEGYEYVMTLEPK
ncbi:MAG: hypothetical protein MI892_22150 [Desulfobacterales bacterium]|nr:hypothetical protein [Desulfobacterales bacterium]